MIPEDLVPLLDVDEHRVFVAMLDKLDQLGIVFVVHNDDHVEVAGPQLPDWCEPILEHWADYVIVVHALTHDGAVFTTCTECSELYLLPPKAVGTPCLMTPCAGTRSNHPPIRFTNPTRNP